MIAYICNYFCKSYCLKLFEQMLAGFPLKLISPPQTGEIFYHIPFSSIGLKVEFSLIISLALRKNNKKLTNPLSLKFAFRKCLSDIIQLINMNLCVYQIPKKII